MPSVMRINGKTETVWDDQGFARLLDEKLGSDARDYFLDALTYHDKNPGEFGFKCSGECDKTYELQRHYEDILREINEELSSWPTHKMTKDAIDQKRIALIRKISGEL